MADRIGFRKRPCDIQRGVQDPTEVYDLESSRDIPHMIQQRQPGLIKIQRFDPRYSGLVLQPDSRPISQEQLASEVKSIYAGLTMVESKCIHVDRAQEENLDLHLSGDHWQALIALHRTLLHEHHEFFLASQHPLASSALRQLGAKNSMPARIWRHESHSFFERLPRRLQESGDHMLAFIYLSYQMMALRYETVPTYTKTWIECLHHYASKCVRHMHLAASRAIDHKHYLVSLICLLKLPKASALNDTTLVQNTATLLRDDSVFDYLVYGIIILYLIATRIFGSRAKAYSQGMMLATAFLWLALVGDTFSAEPRKTTLKVWVGTTVGFVAQDCTDAVDPKLHVVKFIGLSILNQVVGMALQQFSSTSLLNALPPCVTLASIIIWALPQHAHPDQPPDIEQGVSRGPLRHLDSNNHSLENLPASGVHRPQNRPSGVGEHLHRRNSNSIPNSLPHPSHFAVGDDSDELESLRSEGHIGGSNANNERPVHYSGS